MTEDNIYNYCSSVLAGENFIQNLYGPPEKNNYHMKSESFRPFSFLRALARHEDAAVSAMGKKMTKFVR